MKLITVTEALRELSIYDEKISKAMEMKMFIALAKEADKKEADEKLGKKFNANYASITDVIENRRKIKSALIKSNAVTEVTINGEKMTVAEAIDQKNSMFYRKNLLDKLKSQYRGALSQKESYDRKMESEIDNMLSKIASSEAADVKEKREVIEEAYKANHAYVIIDPLDLKTKIEELEASIEGFEKDVDVALALSNAQTIITVD